MALVARQPALTRALGVAARPAPARAAAVDLAPFISLAALLLCEMDARARAALESSARTRVALAASSIDQEMFWLVRTLKALPPVSLANAEDRNIVYARAREAFGKSGITFCARNKGIDLLASAEPGSLKIAAPDGAARMAAITALSTNAPQVTPYSNAEDKADAGINLWLASAANGTDPVLLQARIPLSFFNKILENFAADGTWTMAVIDPDGGVPTRRIRERRQWRNAQAPMSKHSPVCRNLAGASARRHHLRR